MAIKEIMQFFTYSHLPKEIQAVSAPFGILAKQMIESLPDNSEKERALTRLLEAKDCAVRAKLWKTGEKTNAPAAAKVTAKAGSKATSKTTAAPKKKAA